VNPASSFYLPGAAPTSYKIGDRVPLHVNHLTPADSADYHRVQSAFSFDYYTPEFHFCRPSDGPQYLSESLGSILFGDRIQTSPFELFMGKNETCKSVCGEVGFSGADAKTVNARIRQNFDLNWLVDGLPAGQEREDGMTGERFETPGFPMGQVFDDRPLLNNHYDIVIDYHQPSKGNYRVVGIVVYPSSARENKVEGDTVHCAPEPEKVDPVVLSEEGETRVTWTYAVYWRASPTSFATRWDRYLHVYDPRIHWFSLINSAVIVCVLVGMVSTILVRTLRKDIARYNRLDIALDDLNGTGLMEDGVQEDSGWKLVHGDVFRPPKNPLWLSVLLGNGAQLFMMTGFTIGTYSCIANVPLI